MEDEELDDTIGSKSVRKQGDLTALKRLGEGSKIGAGGKVHVLMIYIHNVSSFTLAMAKLREAIVGKLSSVLVPTNTLLNILYTIVTVVFPEGYVTSETSYTIHGNPKKIRNSLRKS